MGIEQTVTSSSSASVGKWHIIRGKLISPWYRYITVEPPMFLYMFAFMITSVVEQDLFVQKACRVNNNFTSDICDNINAKENEEYKRQVQITTAKFHQWESIAAHIFPIVLAFFMGSFSDRRGRRLPLLMGLTGKLIYSVMIVVNAKMKTWPVEYIIYTATLPSALTGADVAIFASCFAYITDVSTLENRTLRVTLLEVCYLCAMPTGVALGSYLFYNPLRQSHSDMFVVNAALLALSIIYSLLFLKWQTTSSQRSLSEVGCCGFFGDFFDIQNAIDSFRVLLKKRANHRQAFLTMLLIAMALYTFQRDENQYLFIYTFFKFDWNVAIFSAFKTFKSSAYVVAMLLAVPIMNKCFHWRDTTLVLLCAWAHIIARFFYYFATSGRLFYAGALICSFGPIVGPMIRSMVSKIVPPSERGKLFALLSLCDNAVPFISGACYSQVYRASLTHDGGGIFLLTVATQLAVFLIILCIHLILGQGSLEIPENAEEETSRVMNENENRR